MVTLGLLLAVAIGLSLGLLGGGGSILTVPVFVYVLGYDARLAVAMSLPVVGVTSAAGAIAHWRAGRLDPRSAASFGVVTMLAAYAAARAASAVPAGLQLALLGVATLVAAASMFRSSSRDASADSPDRAVPRAATPALLASGFGVGVLTGLTGIGGGFMMVPVLVLLAGMPMQRAVGTSLLVIAANCAAGFAGYAGRVAIPWTFVSTFTAIAVAGVIAGTWLTRIVPVRALKRAFAVLLLAIGGLILIRGGRPAPRSSSQPAARPAAGTSAASHQSAP